MARERIIQTREEMPADGLARYSEAWQWKEMVLRGLVGIGAAAIAIFLVFLFVKIARAPSDGLTSDCANVVSMVETLSKDCMGK